MVPGAILVWSGDVPRFDTHRIPEHADGLELGRPIVHPSDDRISAKHARVTLDREGHVRIEDVGSRNGTYVDAVHITSPVILRSPPNLVRLGRSVFVIVPEIRTYEHIPLTKREGLVLGGTLDRVVRAVDLAAVEGDHLTIVGTRSVGVPLARMYARAFGEHFPSFYPPGPFTLETVLQNFRVSVRSLVLELGSARLSSADRKTLDELLETDVRIVAQIRTKPDLLYLPRRFAERIIELPAIRYEELPMTLLNIVREIDPARSLHAVAVEYMLRMAATLDEDRLLERFRAGVQRWRNTAAEGPVRYEHLVPTFEPPPGWVIPPS